MVIGAFFVALVLSLLITRLYAAGLRGRVWGPGLLVFFLSLFLTFWSGGLWMMPTDPRWGGIAFFSFLLVTVCVGILLAVWPSFRRRSASRPEVEAHSDAAIAVDILFWVLIAGVFIAFLARHLAVI